MKKLILLVLASTAIVMTNCTPAAPITPTPAAPAPVAPTTSMTATEAMLVGDWIFDKQEKYMSGSLIETITTSSATSGGTSTTFTLYAGSHMDLTSIISATVGAGAPFQLYNANYYSYYSVSSAWYVKKSILAPYADLLTSGMSPLGLQSGGEGGAAYIVTLNATTLISQGWNIGSIPNGYKLYYHK